MHIGNVNISMRSHRQFVLFRVMDNSRVKKVLVDLMIWQKNGRKFYFKKLNHILISLTVIRRLVDLNELACQI